MSSVQQPKSRTGLESGYMRVVDSMSAIRRTPTDNGCSPARDVNDLSSRVDCCLGMLCSALRSRMWWVCW